MSETGLLESVLTESGIQYVTAVVSACIQYEVPVECACILLVKESGGGRNIYGHDTGGCMYGAGEVTQANYLEYKQCVYAGGRRNGVGPMQLTHWSLQDEADAAGGCWNPEVNILVGVRHFGRLLKSSDSVRTAFRRYNGSGPSAERYADHAMSLLQKWIDIVATSQNGYTANDGSLVSRRNIPGSAVTLSVRKDEAGEILLWVASQFDKRVEDIDTARGAVPDDWGYAERPIRGSTTVLSNHASGTAIDLNALRHPLGAVNTFTAAQRQEILRILDEASGVVRWGGTYTGRKDEMHFEINAPLDRVREAWRKINAPAPTPPPPPPPPSPSRPTLRRGSKGAPVGELQAFMRRVYPAYAGHLSVDNDFGPKTEAVMKEFQRRSNLVADGIVGPRTWAALGF